MKDTFFNPELIYDLASRFSAVYPSFREKAFADNVLNETWDKLELKARMRHITVNLGNCLPDDYEQALAVTDRVVAGYPAGHNDPALMCFPDFVEVYGQDERYWDLSISALERYTPLSTAEFAVRPFIIKNEERMMRQMAVWATHDNEHIRRLASEGCRPALPWGQALPCFKKDPSPILTVLELLKTDPSLYVRKSVANNLNDISKTHPALVTRIASDWYGKDEYTDWIVKHGCRTLLKKGDQETLGIFGYNDTGSVAVAGFALSAAAVAIGEDISFSFIVSASETTNVRLEYAIDYVKANGRRSRKIFRISKTSLNANLQKSYTKSHSFADLSTRKHYPGIHSVTLIANGIERGSLDFELTDSR